MEGKLLFEFEGMKPLYNRKGNINAHAKFYALQVEIEHENYPEKDARSRKWVMI